MDVLINIVICLGLWAWQVSRGLPVTSLALLCIGTYSTVSLLIFSFGGDVPFFSITSFSENELARATSLFYIAAASYCLGHILVDRSQIVSVRVASHNLSGFVRSFERKASIHKDVSILTAALVAPLSVLVAVENISDLFVRYGYSVTFDMPFFMRLADSTLWLAAILVPLIKNPWLRASAFLIVIFPFIGLGSRSAVLFIVVYAIVRKYFIEKNFFSATAQIGAGIFVAAVLINMRPQYSQGILPLVQSGFFAPDIFREILFFVNYVTSYSTVLLAGYMQNPSLDYRLFFQSLNPSPGFLIPIQEIDAWSRFRASIPHPGLGQLRSHLSLMGYSAVFVLLGIGKAFSSSRLVAMSGTTVARTKAILASVLMEIGTLFPILILGQYNLRTGFRILYLVYGLFFLWFAFIAIQNWRNSRGGRVPANESTRRRRRSTNISR